MSADEKRQLRADKREDKRLEKLRKKRIRQAILSDIFKKGGRVS